MVDNLPVTRDEGSEDAVPAAGVRLPPSPTSRTATTPPWSSSTRELHLASRLDSDGVAARDDEVVRLLVTADLRDAAAGRRDSEARLLPPLEHRQDRRDLARVGGPGPRPRRGRPRRPRVPAPGAGGPARHPEPAVGGTTYDETAPAATTPPA